MLSRANLLNLQARGDEMVWLKRQQQADAGHTALVGLMDALLHLQQGDMLHVPGLIWKETVCSSTGKLELVTKRTHGCPSPGFDICTATLWCCCKQMPTSIGSPGSVATFISLCNHQLYTPIIHISTPGFSHQRPSDAPGAYSQTIHKAACAHRLPCVCCRWVQGECASLGDMDALGKMRS